MVRILEEKRDELTELCRKYRIARLEVFGSAARGEDFDQANSDLDFLVEFIPEDDRRYFDDYMILKEALEELFGRKVDLVENMEFRNPYFRDAVNQTRTLIYEA